MISPAPARLPWVDHLRTFAIFLVVVTHSCVTYSHVGSWYVMSDRDPSLNEKLPFILVEGLNQSFFMGLLFFISAYFAEKSLAKRGPTAFARERLFRLGLPTLLFMLVIHPFIVVGLHPWPGERPALLPWLRHYLLRGEFLGSTGPLWFAFALLIFCLVFALLSTRSVGAANVGPTTRPTTAGSPADSPLAHYSILANSNPPSAASVWFFAATLGLATWLVRFVQPLGTSVMNMQLGYFSQYILAFYLGVRAARGGWLVPLAATPQAARAGIVTIVVAPLALLAILIAGVRGGPHVFDGGLHWQAFALAMWEQLTGVGLSLGLLAWFSRHLARETQPRRWLADRSFGVYVLHTPVLIALFLLFRRLPDIPLALAALMVVCGLVTSYVLADLAKRLPGLRAIL